MKGHQNNPQTAPPPLPGSEIPGSATDVTSKYNVIDRLEPGESQIDVAMTHVTVSQGTCTVSRPWNNHQPVTFQGQVDQG